VALTKEQRAAISRANGAKSRGPKTVEGKAISSRNALKTGLLSKKFIIPELESEAEFSKFSLGIRRHYKPKNNLEALVVDRVTTLLWRLRRIGLEEAIRASEENERHSFVKSPSYCGKLDDIDKLTIIEERLSRQLQQAMKELTRLQAAAAEEEKSHALLPSIDITLNRE
jgi:hypothetical protein